LRRPTDQKKPRVAALVSIEEALRGIDRVAQTQNAIASRVLTPAGRLAAVRHRDVPYAENAGVIFGPKCWRILSNRRVFIKPLSPPDQKKPVAALVSIEEALKGIDSKRDCISRFDPCGAPAAVQNAGAFCRTVGFSSSLSLRQT